MNFELKDLPAKLLPALEAVKKYGVFMFFIVVMIVYGFLVFDINRLASREPSQDAVDEKLKTVQIPKLDEVTLQKIKDLQDQNVQVKSLFDQARENPFSE